MIGWRPSWRGTRLGRRPLTTSRMAPVVTSVVTSMAPSCRHMVTTSSPKTPWCHARVPRGPRGSISGARMTTDEFEIWFDKGVTDGLPVVPPTRARVGGMLAGTRRRPDELIGEMPPNYGRLTIEKAAINAVLAGCRPEYLPVVIAAAECACDPAFNLHGVSTSTHFSAPPIVVNGPIRGLTGPNSRVGDR